MPTSPTTVAASIPIRAFPLQEDASYFALSRGIGIRWFESARIWGMRSVRLVFGVGGKS
jgi:hypothetical protein